MYTNKAKQLHEKCLKVLEMIADVNNRIAGNSQTLSMFDATTNQPFCTIQLRYRNREEITTKLAWYKKVKSRLVIYYCNLMEQLIIPAMDASVSQFKATA